VNTDRDGIVQIINHFEGLQVDDIIGKPLVDFAPSIDHKRAMAATRRVLRSGKGIHFETSGRDLENREVWFSVSVGPIFGSSGEIEGLTFIVLDITEKKRSEDEIRDLNTELEALVQERTNQLDTSNQELASLSYAVSHDLRTPLRAIDGFSLALLEDYNAVLDEQGQHYLNRVRVASQRMGILIDDLLRLAFIARQELQSQSVELSDLVHTIANEFLSANPERKIEVLIEPGLSVCGDENLLRIAVSNLFNNAWKFTSLQEQARIEFGCQEINGTPAYFIRDDGVGFDMQYATKLFHPFQHLHGHSKLEGSGVGLAIVQRIVQKHGGRIWAEAQEGQGATFYFTLAPR
jgi:PAS domain S-box-containing protein